MRIRKKTLKKLIKRPQIRPRIVKSLKHFDDNINQEQDTKLMVNRQDSETLNLLRFLVKRADDQYNFNLLKSIVVKRFQFNKPSLNFNFAALHQLKLARINWDYFKSSHRVKGHLNIKEIF